MMKFMQKVLVACVLTLTLTISASADGVIGTGDTPPAPNSIADPGGGVVITELEALYLQPPVEASLSIIGSVLSLF